MVCFLQVEETLELLRLIERTGVAAVGIHGRYEYYIDMLYRL